MSYLDKFDREVLKFCVKNHQAKGEMKKKLMSSGRNQMGHFVAGKPERVVYERFSVRDDFKVSPGGNPSILGTPVSHYFTQDYPLPVTLSDLYTPSVTQRKKLERQRTIKEAQVGRPTEIGFTGLPGRPPQIDLELPEPVQIAQRYYKSMGKSIFE